MIKDIPKKFYSKIGVLMVSIFDKEQKIALRNPARRHSKARKIPSVFKDVPRNVFSEIGV